VKNYGAIIEQLDAEIRSGRPQTVAHQISKINLSRVPRHWRLPLAKICRRAGLYSQGLQLLTRVVHCFKRGLAFAARPPELAEYAALLLRSGSVNEALDYLINIDTKQAPDALLYRSYCHFVRWEFNEAIPFLEAYLASDLSSYAKLVGESNLAYAYVETRQYVAAIALLESIAQIAGENGFLNLECTCRVYRAQVYFYKSEFELARNEIELAQRHSGSQTNDQMLARKWKLILDGVETKSVVPFNELRELAIRNHDWATWREADLFSLNVEFDQQRFLHLYFGTPYTRFRERMVEELGVSPRQSNYILGTHNAPCFDVLTAEIDARAGLKPGRLCHRMIEVLLSDLYQPMRIGALFSALFPGEIFFVSSSPDRVHQLIFRTRKWLDDNQIPVTIIETDGFYSLSIVGQFSFRIPMNCEPCDPMLIYFEKLKAALGPSCSFTAKTAREALGLSKTTVFRLMQWAISIGKVERLGHSSSDAVYQFTEVIAAPRKMSA